MSVLLLLLCLAAGGFAGDRLLGHEAATLRNVGAGSAAGRLLIGSVQAIAVFAPVIAVVVLLRFTRFGLLFRMTGSGIAAAAVWAASVHLLVSDRPAALRANALRSSVLIGAAFPSPVYFAAAVAVTLVAASWLSRSWRHAAWVVLALAGLARLIAGVALPTELLLAFAVGAVVGSGVLVIWGAPDRRMTAEAVGRALAAAGTPVLSVQPAAVPAGGSRPFLATLGTGQRMFIKVLGRDQRDADLLYRGYRLLRFKGIGDSRPAASLRQAVEHQALVGMVAERAGVRVPRVDRIVAAPDGSAILTMALVAGQDLQQTRPEQVTEKLLGELWRQVSYLRAAGVAHRSLRTGNVMVDEGHRPWIVDFSFAELAGTSGQLALDVAELLASLAILVGPERAVGSAAAVLGAGPVGAAVPFLQPLALSYATRRAIGQRRGLLTETREVAAAVSGASAAELPPLQRVRPRTLLMLVMAAGALYFLLPQLATFGSSWRAFQSANWAWLPLVILMSLLTYLAGGLALTGALAQRLPFVGTLLTQLASSFVNRVTPANVGGMALNVRFLQRCGVDPANAVAAVGLNSLAGAVVHAVLIVVFFLWSGSGLTRAFKLPSGSKLLLALAVITAAGGVVFISRWGRRVLLVRLLTTLRSAAADLRQIASSPVKLAGLFGGSCGVTLAYIGALTASLQAFGGGIDPAKIGAVYLAASALAAAAPTPGGLGPLEAALIAGLTGVGIPTGPAVSTVLTYRLATYWLPVLPGWLAWHLLRRWDYI